jgi:hypothetical protein
VSRVLQVAFRMVTVYRSVAFLTQYLNGKNLANNHPDRARILNKENNSESANGLNSSP